MKLTDSYGWVEYFSDGPLARKYGPFVEGLSMENAITPTIVLYEVYKKLKKEKGEQLALEAVAHITRTRIVPLDEAVGISAADVCISFGLALADAIIYSTALVHGAELVTSDPHFRRLEESGS